MARVVITEFMDEPAVADIARHAETLYDPALVDKPEALAAALADCVVLIVRNRTQVRPALLERAPHLEMVGRLGVGLDNIDMDACAARGIAVHPATGANDLSVAEYVITAALVLLRGAWGASAAVAAGSWPRNALIGREAAGKTLGLVGVGRIARETARIAGALGFRIAGFDPLVPAEDPAWTAILRHETLESLTGAADVVSLHVPLTPATRGMISAAVLAGMKPGAVLINAARGGVVDEAALAFALKAGRLGGAALDVFDKEPLSAADGARFADCPNLLLTPHIAGVTVESNERVSRLIADLAIRHLARHVL
ncbi:hydroxyacid dehydrogenase [Prosthecomicrobium sp. N25]|uniref:hydroxyacid dehydrogenase n=1 Tax=Prosthecomicrobium sp. N25 TaxID=3129254 RepID=UPI003077B66E